MKGLCFVGLLLVSLLLGGCGVSQGVYNETVDEWQAQVETLQDDLSVISGELQGTQDELQQVRTELLVAQEQLELLQSESEDVGYFHSSSQLSTWLGEHRDLQTSGMSSIYEDYYLALELQKEALGDGYIVNVYVIDDGEGGYWVWCDVYVDTGDIYYWTMLDFGTLEWYGNW